MLLKEEKFFYAESYLTGERYTSFFFFSCFAAEIKTSLLRFEAQAGGGLLKKGSIGKNLAVWNRIGARFYDPELGVWLTPDNARQYTNPYSMVGGDPVNYVDVDGNVGLYINGIGGQDDPDFRLEICQRNPTAHCGSDAGDRARYGQAYTGFYPGDAAFAFLSPLALQLSPDVYDALRDAYRQGQADGTGLHVFAHSGGASVSGYNIAVFNYQRGYGSVDSRTTFQGFDLLGIAGAATSATGTRSRHYYNTFDPVSWGGAVMDLISPDIADPGRKFDVFNLDRWKFGFHTNKNPNSYSIWDLTKDVSGPVGGSMLDFGGIALDNTSRGLSSAYFNYVNPFGHANRFYRIWSSDEPWNNKLASTLEYFPNQVINMIGDTGKWVGHTAVDLGNSVRRGGERIYDFFFDW